MAKTQWRPLFADLLRPLLGPFYDVQPEEPVSDRLAVLSDALEEAGCTDADFLFHLRSEGPHVRGCWALDLLLGK